MALYLYECEDGHEQEELVRKPEDVPTKCKVCGKPLTKKMGKTSFQLKGTGWSADGYADSY